MENEFQNYKRYTGKCTCGCLPHCGYSCQDCEYCADCECAECKEIDKNRGNN